ncbi:hypothetical protein F5Y03DRAFT_364290 [Xylaria venustula]|nr:hypothetical protein F5Y03DRAFT_364290 [Xylaria venustula]
MVVSTAVVNVFPVTVVGDTVNVSVEDETSVLVAIPELGDPGGLLSIVVAFITGYGAELDGCTDMAGELPLALVRLAPEKDSEAGAVPEEVNGAVVTMDVVGTPVGMEVAPMRLDELVPGKGGVLPDDAAVEMMLAPVSEPECGAVFVPTPGVV